MFKNFTIAVFTGAALAQAQRLLVTSQSSNASTQLGQVLTLEAVGVANAGTRNLTVIQTSEGCGISPTWLDVTLGRDTVLCLDEFATPNLTALHIESDGSLKVVSKIPVEGGPVASIAYNAKDGKADIALAHYGPKPQISLLTADVDLKFESFQNFTFDTSINETAATASKIHQAVQDPTGNFMLFPDLGSDMIHVYKIDNCTGTMVEFGPLVSKKNSGPRHATFFRPSNSTDTFLFVVHELSNRIVSYKVDYIPNGGLTFTIVTEVSTFGDREPSIDAKAAEIAVSPDNRFVIASNRNATIFDAANPDPNNSTRIPSDSIVTFKPEANGNLTFVQLTASGGLFPRHFQMNKDGSQIAVANQNTRNVVIFKRNIETGKIEDPVAASVALLGVGILTYVQFIG
jgi:6-phosphogluconolactonase (cycloisomerase 2 family)